VLAYYGVGRADIDRLVEQIRASHYEALRTSAAAGEHLRLGMVGRIPRG